MVIGIIGTDDRAVSIGRLLSRCGHEISFSDPVESGRAEKARDALAGSSAEMAYEQAAKCETLVLAVHWEDLDIALAALGAYKNGIVIDATRPPKLDGDDNGAQLLAKKLDNRHVVKAFVEELVPNGPVQVAANDPEARAMVCGMIESCGGKAIDIGPLSEAAHIESAYAKDATAIRGVM